MEIFRVERGLVLVPPVHLCTIVWLHGLGDSAQGFQDLFTSTPLLENCKVVLPTAKNQPVTVNGGLNFNSWYDFKTIEDEYDVSAEESVETLIRILDEERTKTDCLILGGLSQGAVMSLYTGLAKYTKKIEAIVALSGYAFPMSVPDNRKSIPVLMYHGALDPLLTLDRARRTSERYLQQTNLTFQEDPNLGHTISNTEWKFVSDWLKEKCTTSHSKNEYL